MIRVFITSLQPVGGSLAYKKGGIGTYSLGFMDISIVG